MTHGSAELATSDAKSDLEVTVDLLQSELAAHGDAAFDLALAAAYERPAHRSSRGAWQGALLASAFWIGTGFLFTLERSENTPHDAVSSIATAPQQPVATAPEPPAQAGLDVHLGILEMAPNDLASLNEVTRILLQQDEVERAGPYLERARVVAPEHPDVLSSSAVIEAKRGNHEQAASLVDRALRSDPDHPRSLVYKALLLMQFGRHAEAIAPLERALVLVPDEPQLPNLLTQARHGARNQSATR